ncbi:YrdB family protein [Aeromicrobium endophyticum]|uniref:DUF2568 domain-containing protein n=1 Tax=Aeromicrobium endophyticum TaxID=2292704 RepID=A0A371P177_9ACTN|nr:YrdB family protein [Aeromicrobium endophyticum]REK69675.1 DUF2568 domain-containing protein [Aeromicrobium endophyticum]
MPPQKPVDLGPLDAVAFLCEVAMVVLLVLAGHGFVDGWRGWAAGVFLALVAIGIWAQWMAPTSVRRLELPTRLVVQIMLFLTTALYAAAGGLLWPGLVFAVVAITVFVALSRQDA